MSSRSVIWTVLPGGSYWRSRELLHCRNLDFYTVALALKKEDSVPMDDPSLKTHEKLAILGTGE